MHLPPPTICINRLTKYRKLMDVVDAEAVDGVLTDMAKAKPTKCHLCMGNRVHLNRRPLNIRPCHPILGHITHPIPTLGKGMPT